MLEARIRRKEKQEGERQAADLARVVADHAADGADTEGELCLTSVALPLRVDLLQEFIHALLTRLFHYPQLCVYLHRP